jgi:methionyl-tRNA synthetase
MENESTIPAEATTPQVAETSVEATPAPIYATIDDFAKIEIRIGTILTVDYIEGADKLLRLTIDFGEAEPRQILSGIRKYYTPEELVGKQCPFVVNLAPRTMKGLTSYGMILAARTGDDKLALLHTNIPTDVGAHVG